MDTRDEVIDYVRYFSDKTNLPAGKLIGWLGIARSKYYGWARRYGQVNEHNAWVPRDHWLTPQEKDAIVAYHDEHPLEGYRRLTYMMLDEDVAAASPASVYRVLRDADRLRRWNPSPSSKGTGFTQPIGPHEHWHMDIAYVNVCGTFYYLCSVLDGFSRYIVHWEIRESMTEGDVEIVLQRAREAFPNAGPRVITDNGPQFVARDFKAFIRLAGMTHVRTRPYYPQSNGKLERYHRTLKSRCLRPGVPLSLADAQALVGRFVDAYNTQRLHAGIGYVTPADKLAGRAEAIWADRERKLAAAREARRQQRQTSGSAEPLESRRLGVALTQTRERRRGGGAEGATPGSPEPGRSSSETTNNQLIAAKGLSHSG
jgi:transposase InsO family protein